MLKPYLSKLWSQAWSKAFEDAGMQLGTWLFRARRHTTRFTTHRVATIVARVRLIAALFAVVSPLWVLMDLWAFDAEISQDMALLRTVGGVAFAAVVILAQGAHTLRDAYRALFFLFAIPAAFYLFAYMHVLRGDPDGVLDGFALGIGSMPFVMLAGLALFPLTVAESATLAIFVLGVNVVASGSYVASMSWAAFFGTFWVLVVVGSTGVLAALSQLTYLIIVTRDGLRDSLTGAYSRRPGEEFLELQFTWSERSRIPLALALVEIDRIKELNAQFGYVAGDAALVGVTQKLNDSMRTGDTLIRWTGKQHLLIFPSAGADQATDVLGRLLSAGLGVRPDGQPLTASVGVAERIWDAAEDWWRLIDLAASRMSAAQRAGGNRTDGPEHRSDAVPPASG
jgi:diguanylate cyclase (GGDEF)-like protein